MMHAVAAFATPIVWYVVHPQSAPPGWAWPLFFFLSYVLIEISQSHQLLVAILYSLPLEPDSDEPAGPGDSGS